jgi:hypothetical protein
MESILDRTKNESQAPPSPPHGVREFGLLSTLPRDDWAAKREQFAASSEYVLFTMKLVVDPSEVMRQFVTLFLFLFMHGASFILLRQWCWWLSWPSITNSRTRRIQGQCTGAAAHRERLVCHQPGRYSPGRHERLRERMPAQPGPQQVCARGIGVIRGFIYRRRLRRQLDSCRRGLLWPGLSAKAGALAWPLTRLGICPLQAV